MDKKEIIEVLRIIRNTANFNNVVYVVSYDKGYILTAIKDFNEYNFKSFLEKIFQFEFTLPMYEYGVLRSEIKKLLKESLEDRFHMQIDRVVDSKDFYGVNFTNEVVKTYRDVVRLVNSLLFEIESVQDEIYFYDFYLLQLLKLEYPKVYEALINSRYLFFTTDGEKGLYRFKTEEEAWKSDDILSFDRAFTNNTYHKPFAEAEEIRTSFEKYLSEVQKELEFSDYDKSLIKYLLKTLLTLKDVNKEGTDFDLYKSFAYPANFHKYFAFRLYEGDISAREFEDYRRRDFNEYKFKVLEWLAQGKYTILNDRLDKVEEFSSVKEFENHILILFEIGRITVKENENNTAWMDCSLILKNLKYPTAIGKRLRLYPVIEDFRDFLFRILKEAKKPPIYESLIVARTIGSRFEISLTFDELSEINLNYFKDYCTNHSEITSEFRQLHTHAIRISENDNSSYEIIPEADELFLEYFKNNLQANELSGFIRQTTPGQQFYYINKDWLFKIFNSWEGFEEYLKLSENIKKEKDVYDEFLIFYNKTKERKYSAVDFVFEKLKVFKFD
ncbi:P-loop NTPase fold protein [Ferruginibacter sp.]|nr:hypothetical protein [Ferruginibacter sp.]